MPNSFLEVAAAQLKLRRTVPENVALICGLIRAAARSGCDAILFPECALTGYNQDFRSIARAEIEEGLKAVALAARAHACYVLLGTPTFSGSQRHNSLVIFDRRGRRIFCYNKIHLTARDARWFTPGNAVALFRIDGVLCTAILCHERRFPELVRLPVMMGARIVFHSNAGLDTLEVSKAKRGGRDGLVVRAFENQVFYIFANSVGPQGDGYWSAGDSKMVAPDSRVLGLANNRDEMLIQARLDLAQARRLYAREALQQPKFLRNHWRAMLNACRRQLLSRP